MDVFALRERVIGEYRDYVRGFVTVREKRTQSYVDEYFKQERLWPEPLVQLNPSFEPGRSVDSLVGEGMLHSECGTIFRRRSAPETHGDPIVLHRHQTEAIAAALGGKSYVLTTGTGSGKSLAYFVPIVDRILRAGPGRGIKAIVVYPMNALCNSQADALEGFLRWGYPEGRGPVRYARYTGQEDESRRLAIQQSPPDILLTNYVMLELILTRGEERPIVNAAQGLEFLVLDELHTYRGRQGADVAMLARRVRERCGSTTVRYVGTSATLAAEGTREERRVEVAAVASRLFGAEVPPVNVIGETLRRATDSREPSAAELAAELRRPPNFPAGYDDLTRHPLAIWAETAFGLQTDALGRLERRSPRSVSSAARDLGALSGVDPDICAGHLRSLLLVGSHAFSTVNGFPLFAFRLHQFVSRGDTIYTTPEPHHTRPFSAEGQVFVPGDRSRRLFPLAFCRACGQDYLAVLLEREERITPRDIGEKSDEVDVVPGFLVVSRPDVLDPLADLSLLPDDWTEVTSKGETRIKASARKRVPRPVRVKPDGQIVADGQPGGEEAWFLPSPFRFCIGCGITYASGRESEFSRLAGLSSGGRSTDTTILSISTIRALRGDADLKPEARKLLSFTDNRQDASLQAGHFNDFVQVALLRSAILAALEQAGASGLGHDEISQAVTTALHLDVAEYASNPEALFAARRATDEALRDVVGYLLYHDLRRGWRVVAPNLEQVGCLRLRYEQLDELCAYEPVWKTLSPDLASAAPEQRFLACKALLDHMRRSLAIKVRYLDPLQQDRLKQQSYQYLRTPWAIDQEERLRQSTGLIAPGGRARGIEDVTLGSRSLLGRFLRRGDTWPNTRGPGQRVPPAEFDRLATDLLKALVQGGFVEAVPGNDGAFRLQAGVMRWYLGDGAIEPDPIRVTMPSAEEVRVNAFFSDLYNLATVNLRQLEAREHTAQVPSADRADREARFGRGTLPVLYCSPTMELGVDIQDLNSVNLRNVPPTPANYAQRSGRAGRSGQAALVLTYCTSTSPHDQYYFRRPERMVAGAVVPPRIDLANEDLIRAHVHAVWLAETGQSLFASVSDLLDLAIDAYPLKTEVRAYVDQPRFQLTARQRCERLMAWLAEDLTPARAPWYTGDWLARTIQGAPLALDRAADRWRNLYRTARVQQDRQHRIVADALRSEEEHRGAARLREEAESQIKLLTRAEPDVFSDFYSYRYFATEGFLPGYNFPRLPVTAYIPGRLRGRGKEEYLSRARFVAISEFGPRSILYHEGNKYRVTRVVLPPEENGSRTRSAHFCRRCGYGHFADRLTVDVCDRCGVRLDGVNGHRLDNLLRLDSVSTYRAERISCNEEERLQLGYEVRTVYRFGTKDDGTPAIRSVIFEENGETRARGAYGPATTIWRVNQGWNRRKERATLGFLLDMEKGTWSKSDLEPDESEGEVDPLASPSSSVRVIPFVEDRRNAFVLDVLGVTDAPTLLSVQYALKRGIEARYQLEGSELAVESLPNEAEASLILFYEASEGGAGVLVRLAEDPMAMAAVAREALAVCHFDPTTGADLHRAVRATEDCEAACYDCLLSYTNQRYHDKLDRLKVKDVLARLAQATGLAGPSARNRGEHRDLLLRTCGSELERDFLRWVDDNRHRLPDRGQGIIDGTVARPDFVYDGDALACVYVDGAPHRFADRQARDQVMTLSLKNLGWTVIRVGGPETWPDAARQFPWIFGTSA